MTAKSYSEHMAEDRRLVILRLLEESNDYQANQFILHQALAPMGHAVSHDTLEGDLEWLREQRLITLDQPGEVKIARLTNRGADVARGRANYPGVKRAEPGR